MSRFLGLPTLYEDFILSGEMDVDVVGAALSGGRNTVGESISVETSGGGTVVCSYANCNAFEAEHHEYLNALGARLNGGYRHIVVPIMTDGAGPFPIVNNNPVPIIRGIPHSDGTGFSDGSAYSQATVWGEITGDAPLNAGIVKMRIYGAVRTIRWSDWFSLCHDEGPRPKGHRAYRTWETLDSVESIVSIEGEPMTVFDVTLAISPPLRQAVTAGKPAEFARPRFTAKFPHDFTLIWKVTPPFHARGFSLHFIEAF